MKPRRTASAAILAAWATKDDDPDRFARIVATMDRLGIANMIASTLGAEAPAAAHARTTCATAQKGRTP